MQESQLLWVGPALRVVGDPFWFDLTRLLCPGTAELGWGLGLSPARAAPGDAQTKQLYIPRWQRSPVPLLAPELGTLGNNLVNIYSHVLYCKLTCYKTDLAWSLLAHRHLSTCLPNYCISLRTLKQIFIRLAEWCAGLRWSVRCLTWVKWHRSSRCRLNCSYTQMQWIATSPARFLEGTKHGKW